MRKRYLFMLLFYVVFIPRVYAFTYEVNAEVVNTSVKVGTVTEIRVSLENVKGTDDGISSCSLDIEFSNGILLDSKIRTLEEWTMTTGEFYLFDTGDAINNSGDMFIIPVRVNDNGTVKIYDIKCSDGNFIVQVNDKVVDFDINNIQKEDNATDIVKDSNCDLTNIELSEGTIGFDSDVIEYNLKVTNYDDLEIIPILASDSASYSILKEKDNKVTITVSAEDGTEKKYILYVEEVSSFEMNKDNNNSYVPVFIVIICVLLLINVVRIIVNKVRRK